MADESMLDKALGLIPGVGVKKTRPRPAADKASVHIANLKKGLSKLSRDLERLVGIVRAGKKAAAKPARKSAGAKSAAKATSRRSAKKPAARKQS
ncbi:MAG TPA: hypothetical protein VFB16_00455 [Bauldia sp.]|nr:hypothetical protein [Bauldia sp.]